MVFWSSPIPQTPISTIQPQETTPMSAHSSLLFTALCAVALASSTTTADDTVSMVCTSVETTPRHFGLMLVPADKTWQEFEPGNAQNFFKTKKGVYVYINTSNTVFICNTATVADCIRNKDSQAAQLTPMLPQKKGDHGNGYAEESGVAFSWVVN
jgi:hypothetical protein